MYIWYIHLYMKWMGWGLRIYFQIELKIVKINIFWYKIIINFLFWVFLNKIVYISLSFYLIEIVTYKNI